MCSGTAWQVWEALDGLDELEADTAWDLVKVSTSCVSASMAWSASRAGSGFGTSGGFHQQDADQLCVEVWGMVQHSAPQEAHSETYLHGEV